MKVENKDSSKLYNEIRRIGTLCVEIDIAPVDIKRLKYIFVGIHKKYAPTGVMKFTHAMKSLYYHFYTWQIAKKNESGEYLPACYCNQSHKTIAEEIGSSERSVIEDIDKLFWAGVLKKEGRGQGKKSGRGSPTNRYEVISPSAVACMAVGSKKEKDF